MILFLLLLIPVLSIGITQAVPAWRHRVEAKEMWIPLLAWLIGALPPILISKNSGMHDTEFWNHRIETVVHYEAWNERVSCSHPKYRTDSKGNTHFVGYMHSYDVDHHPERWVAESSSGSKHRISKTSFDRVVSKFGYQKPVFKDMRRDYHTIDGDAHLAHWPETFETIEPCVESHSYVNRVQASRDSILSYPELSESERALVYEYPPLDGYWLNSVLGKPNDEDALWRLNCHNARLGESKHVRMWLLIFDSADRELGFLQEAHWTGGNKNEVVVCLGNGWAHVFCWENEELKVTLRNAAITIQSHSKLVDEFANLVEQHYEMVDWSKFDYLSVQPSLAAILTAFFLTLAGSVGATVVAIQHRLFDHTATFGHQWRLSS